MFILRIVTRIIEKGRRSARLSESMQTSCLAFSAPRAQPPCLVQKLSFSHVGMQILLAVIAPKAQAGASAFPRCHVGSFELEAFELGRYGLRMSMER
jgi:hypothetical protein